MKLVEILAKELGEWPMDSCLTICQDTSGDIGAWRTLRPEVTCPDDDDVVWSSMGHIMNITPLSCIATDHATAIVTREMWQAERVKAAGRALGDGSGLLAGYTRNPFAIRDRIREIDASIEAMTAERAELVSKLAGEGFALIAVAAEPVEDMSDWRNWKAGDLLRMENEDEWCGVSNGRLYKLESDIAHEFVFIDDSEEERRFKPAETEFAAKDFSWHSRPSA